MFNFSIVTKSREETQLLAEAIGRVLKGGEVFELVSDIGGGKTTFTKGLAKGLGVTDTVQSPTFTISRIYKGRDNMELHHFDFYRLTEPGVIPAALAESMAQTGVVVVIEWGEMVYELLPPGRAKIRLSSAGDTSRRFSFRLPPEYEHVAEVLKAYEAAGSSQ